MGNGQWRVAQPLTRRGSLNQQPACAIEWLVGVIFAVADIQERGIRFVTSARLGLDSAGTNMPPAKGSMLSQAFLSPLTPLTPLPVWDFGERAWAGIAFPGN